MGHVHLRHLNPFPSNLGEILSRFKRILVPELNRGQLARLLRAEYLAPAESYPKVKGLPFLASEILEKINHVLKDDA